MSSFQLPILPQFRQVPGWPMYVVGDDGSVWSYHKHNNWPTPRKATARKNSRGYWQVLLCDNGRRKLCYVHRLVIESFCGPRQPGLVARHLDDNKDNNLLWNIRWGTQSANQHDSIRNGRIPLRGSAIGGSKLTEEQALAIRSCAGQFYRKYYLLAKQYGVSVATISMVIHRKVWKHV